MAPKKLAEKFKDERENVLSRLWEILDHKTEIVLAEMDHDEDLKANVMGLKNDVCKYYPCCSLLYRLKSELDPHDRDYLRIVKYILQSHGFRIVNSRCQCKINGNKILTQKYIILPSNPSS